MTGSSSPPRPPEEAAGPVWSLQADWTEPIRRRPVPVALAALVVAALLGWRIGLRPEAVAFAYLGAVGVVLSVIDIALKRLPDPLTYSSYPIGLVLLGIAVPFTDGGRFGVALLGMVAMFGLFAVQWFIVPHAMGLGDVKLSGTLGLYLGWLGWDAWILGLFGMFVLGGVYALAMLISRRAGRGATIPFGPFMIAGTLVAAWAYA